MMRTAKIMMTYLRKRYPWLFIILRIAAAVLGAPGFSFFGFFWRNCCSDSFIYWRCLFSCLLALSFFLSLVLRVDFSIIPQPCVPLSRESTVIIEKSMFLVVDLSGVIPLFYQFQFSLPYKVNVSTVM